MSLQKVLLYYGFTPINDPVAVQLWQKTLCESLNLKGCKEYKEVPWI
jgi:UPF0176 protein